MYMFYDNFFDIFASLSVCAIMALQNYDTIPITSPFGDII